MVRWVGCKADEDTIEPEAHLLTCKALLAFWKGKKNSTELMRVTKLQEAVLKECEEASRRRSQPLQPDAYFRADRAYHAIDANKLDDAEAATRAALAVQPDSLQLNLLLLDVLTRKGQWDGARTQADALVQKYPNVPRV